MAWLIYPVNSKREALVFQTCSVDILRLDFLLTTCDGGVPESVVVFQKLRVFFRRNKFEITGIESLCAEANPRRLTK
jgi:hypothetical protein